MGFINNKETEIPTHFCWVCKKVFIFPDNRKDHVCLLEGCGGILLAYFDDPAPSIDPEPAVSMAEEIIKSSRGDA